ncbi:MAG: hypothetical protein MJ188_03055 [Treponema sp.]|nr:hypothetical protein [Treponema sp.]
MGEQVEEKEVVTYGPDGSKKVTRTVNKTVQEGIGFGSALAMVISFCTWKSVGWAILHGLLGWAYVIYYVIKY